MREKNFLIAAFQHLQKQQDTISTLMTEIAALRDSLCEIGPKYDEVLSRHRAHHARLAKPLAAEALFEYEEIIQQLRDLK